MDQLEIKCNGLLIQTEQLEYNGDEKEEDMEEKVEKIHNVLMILNFLICEGRDVSQLKLKYRI